jgi:hypothetical protein
MEVVTVRPATLDEMDWIADLSDLVQGSLTASGCRRQVGRLPFEMIVSSIQSGLAYVLESSRCRLGCILVDPLTATFPVPLDRWGLVDLEGSLWYVDTLLLEPEVQGREMELALLEGVKRYVVSDLCGTIIFTCWAGDQRLCECCLRAGFTFRGVFDERGYEIAVFLFP